MKDIFLLAGIIMRKNRVRLMKGLYIFIFFILADLICSFFNEKNLSTFLKYCLLFYPFLFTWYFCSSMDLRFFHVNILPRNISRSNFFWSNLICCSIAILPLFCVIISFSMQKLFTQNVGIVLSELAFALFLVTLDFFLFVAIAYSFCMLGFPVISFLFVFIPAVITFKSAKLFAMLQINYAFPLYLSSENMNELYDVIGADVHIVENIVCALAFLYICNYFYKSKDITI